MKMTRKIINIDEELCDGCGLCIPSCHEQAIQLVETPNGKKARLVKEIYCDGLGACLGTCPTGALTIEEREAEAFDEEATQRYIAESAAPMAEPETPAFQGCPSARAFQWDDQTAAEKQSVQSSKSVVPQSELRQWPVQLHLVPPNAPYFHHANLVMAADCVPFAYANFHQEFLKGDENAIAVGCPKLDDTSAYLEKLTQIIRLNQLKSIHIVNMEVPCCFGLVHLIQQAIDQAGVDVPVKVTTISIKGDKLT
ncbi:MAG: 4Fe-4S dicluster domain-containing protein [Candidatus Vecturithrix sp.]|jgi:NAD-dependent dihydropyrimidine dehydrogenase PreA subunit|nr:4Fe-4S dicluster domain-containing protein [Candidatus Vecturithrix sp.]